MQELRFVTRVKHSFDSVKSWPGSSSGAHANTASRTAALYERHLLDDTAGDPLFAAPRDQFEAFAHSVRDIIARRWVLTRRTYARENPKMVYYLSTEYLIGRSLANNVTNLMLDAEAQSALAQENVDWIGLLEEEPDAGLGNGGLGRLAACFLDSMAALQLLAMGYGLPRMTRPQPANDGRTRILVNCPRARTPFTWLGLRPGFVGVRVVAKESDQAAGLSDSSARRNPSPAEAPPKIGTVLATPRTPRSPVPRWVGVHLRGRFLLVYKLLLLQVPLVLAVGLLCAYVKAVANQWIRIYVMDSVTVDAFYKGM
jgi:hypothetical protein